MAFDIPRVSGTVQPNKLIDDTQLISVLARQILASRLAQARAAAGGDAGTAHPVKLHTLTSLTRKQGSTYRFPLPVTPRMSAKPTFRLWSIIRQLTACAPTLRLASSML